MKFRLLIPSFIIAINGFAQMELPVKISGRVVDDEGKTALYRIMIINKRTGTGMFATHDGNFSITALRSDTLLFGAMGFAMKKVSLKDSAYKPEYHITVRLNVLSVNLKQVDVRPLKKLGEIDKERQTLGVP